MAKIKIRHLPERWLVRWVEKEKDGKPIERQEFFNSEEDALVYAKEIEKDLTKKNS